MTTDGKPAALGQRLYNPDWLSDDDLVRGFIARQELFGFLRDELARAPLRGNVQHYLLVGVRGSGKTTMLKRLAVAIRRDADLQDHLLALSFPEELYQVKHLADFWWAAGEALVEELDGLGQADAANRLAEVLERDKPRGPNPNPLGDEGLRRLLATCAAAGRRPVLLIDNLDLIFQRIDKSGRRLKDPHAPAYWALREALSRVDAPLVIAGSVRLSEPFVDYDKAFYDFFVPHRLGKLSLEEAERVLAGLADGLGAPEVTARLRQRPGRLEALYELTGGNPRALGLIFDLLRQGPGSRAVEDFERLMDLTTPYYKARFEDLAEQAQVVMHALAVRRRDHRPEGGRRFGHTAAEIGEQAGLETGTVSAQMGVLEREGLVEKSAAHGRTQYRIAEQLFRLWLQMRASRRIRLQVLGLAEFLEALFEREELEASWRQEAARGNPPLTGARLAFAYGEGQPDDATRRTLDTWGADRVLEHTAGSGEALGDYLGRGDLAPELEPLAEMRDRLQHARDPQLDRLPRDALLGSLALDLAQKQASVARLCDPATAAAELEALLPCLEQERRRLQRLGLAEGEIALLFAHRASGRLPLPWLTAAEVEAAVRVTGLGALRPLAWRLLCSRELVKIPDAQTAADWVAWGLAQAGQAGPQEWANAAGTLRRNRQFDAARQALDQAFQRGDSARAWYERGVLLAETQGDPAEAEAAYRQAIALDPSLAYPWNNLGYLLADKPDRHAEAEAAFRQAIALDPSYVQPWHNLGALLANKPGRHAEAEAAYRQAIALDPSDAWPWTNLGRLLEDQGRLEEAEPAYARGVELDPENFYRRRRLQELRARRALTRAQDALAVDDWPQVRETLHQLPAAADELASWLASPALVEGLVGQALARGQGAILLGLLRELGFERRARPLLLALEARLAGNEDSFVEAEPEIRRAAKLLFRRLGPGGGARR